MIVPPHQQRPTTEDGTAKPNTGEGHALIAMTESFIKVEHRDRDDPEQRAIALDKAERLRGTRLTADARRQFIHCPEAFPAAAPLSPRERWHGTQYEDAKHVGFDVYAELECHEGQAKMRATVGDERAIEAAKWRLRRDRPELFASVTTATTLDEAIDAIRHDHQHATGPELVRLVSQQRPDLIARQYGRPTPAQAERAQQQNATQQWCDDAVAWWREQHGAPPTYQERSACFTAYAQKHPARVPGEQRAMFRLAPVATSEVARLERLAALDTAAPSATPTVPAARDPRIVACTLGAIDRQERDYLQLWASAARQWWREQPDGDDNEATALERFARQFPMLTPAVVGELFNGLSGEVRKAEKDAAREAHR